MATSTRTEPGFQSFSMALGDELRRRGAGDQHAADDEIGRGAFVFDRALRRIDGLELGAEAGDQFFHAVGALLEDGDISAHAERHRRRIGADHAAAEDDDLGRSNARNAAEQHAAAALGLLEAMGAGLDRHAACNLAHRRQQRQAAARAGHGLIGDADGARLDQVLGLLRIGREMEVGVEDLAFAQHRALDRLRFLDLHDHVGLGEDLGGSRR